MAEPEESRSGLFSVGLIALAAYLKGRCHVSFRALRAFFEDVLGIGVSGGFPAKQIKRGGGALKGVHEQLMERLKGEKHLHIDRAGGRKTGRSDGYGRFGRRNTRYSSSGTAGGRKCLRRYWGRSTGGSSHVIFIVHTGSLDG
jgi:hypothetical protein